MAQLLKSPDLLTMAYTLGGSKQHGAGVIGQGLYKEVMDDTSLRKNLLATGSKLHSEEMPFLCHLTNQLVFSL